MTILHSLRARLILLTLVVALIAVACVGLLLRRYTIINFNEYVAGGEELGLGRFGPALAEHRRRSGGWDGVQPLLDEIAAATGKQVVLADSQGRVVATSPAELMRADIQVGPGHSLTWRREEPRGRNVLVEQLALESVPHVVVEDGAGGAAGSLYAVPLPDASGDSREELFVGEFNRTLLLAGSFSAAVALLIALVLSRRILGPVEELTAAVRRMEAGDLGRRVKASSRDEIGALARAFNSMADELARVERLRRNMVGDVAHELRTPLTNIRCQIESVQDGVARPTPEVINSLHEEAMTLGRLVDDLQDLALAEAGQLSLRPQRVSVGAEVAQALNAMRPRLGGGGLSARSDIPEGCPDVLADRERLGQVLRNLLDNAVTHTPPGGVISVRARPAGAGVELSVEDTGAGIAAGDLPYVFERFYRADASRDRATGGAGLGLAIVRQIVAAHGGEARVESEPGKGTKIHFTLPAFRP